MENERKQRSNQLLSIRETSETTTLSRVTIWRKIKAGDFPVPIAIGKGRKAFLASEISDWINERAAARDEVAA